MTTPPEKERNFEGHHPRMCGEHRTVGPHRAWCFDCGEWCYPTIPCARCTPVVRMTRAQAEQFWAVVETDQPMPEMFFVEVEDES